MKRLKSYFFTNSNLNSRGKYISLKDNAEPNETLFNDLLDSVVKPKVGADYQDQADFNAVNTKDSSKFVTAENLPEVDSSGSLLTITTTAAVDTNLLRRKKYTVSANIPSSISDISSRLTTKLVTPANLPKFALDNSEYTQVASQLPYFAPSVVVTTDGVDFYQTYSLKLRALESTMMTHAGVRLDTVLDGLRTDVNACVSDSELASAVNSLNLAINNKANKVSPNFVAGYNGTKVTVNSQGIVTTVTKASASDITNDSSVSGSTVKDALNWLKANGGGVGGASDTDGVTNLSDVPGGTATDALNNLLDSLSHYFVKDVVGKTNGDTLEVDKINVLTLSSDTSFTLPTPSLAYKGKVLIIVQGNGGVNRAEIFGGLQGSVIISDLSDILIYNCVYDIGGGGNWVLISRDDSKMCQIPVIVESSTHYASANENIKADALSFGANQSVVIPASNSEGRMIYVYYPTGAPTAFVVNLTGGYTATLNQGDWFLLRDNGSFWEAIGTSQNTVDLSPYATIDSPTFTGIPAGPTASPGTNTTQLATTAFVTTAIGAIPSYLGTANRITVSAGVIDISSAYVGQSSITTVGTLTSGALGSGFTAIADAYIASAATWNGKFNTPTGLTTNYISKWNGSTFVDSLILSRAGGLTLQNSTVIDLNTEGKSYFEFYPLLRNTVGTPRFALDLFPETSTQFAGFVSAVINITSGGDVVSGKNTVMNGITATHRSTDGTNGNRPFLNINAIMLRPNISANSASASGVHHITSQNADNYSSIVQDGASGFNPINYSAYSLRANAIGFSHVKNVVANSGVQSRHNFNQLATTQTTWSNGFGFDIRNTLANSNASPQIVNFTEEYIIQNQGAGTVHAGKRYRYEAGNQSAASAHIMGLYRTGVIIGDTTALPNALCSLDLDSATTGLGLNRVAGDLGTTRNGNIWYNTVSNTFKGIANATVRTLAFAGDTYKFDELLQLTDCNATFATANTVVYMAFIPKGDIAVTKIYYNLQSAGTDTVRVGIYADASNSPTTLIVQANEATTGATTTGHRSITISSTNLTAGTRYWIGIKNDNGASSFLSKNNVYSNNITKESNTSGVLVASPTTYSSLNAVWVGIGV